MIRRILFAGLTALFCIAPLSAEGGQEGNKQGASAPSSPERSKTPQAFSDSMLKVMDESFASEESEFTAEDEYYLGRAAAASILSSYRPYTANPALTNYLNRICQTIVINSPRPEIWNGYHVLILDSREFNAVGTPGGHILLSRGLVEAADSEDALAAVIAHELAHIQCKHSIDLVREMEPVNQANDAYDRAMEFNRARGSKATVAAADKLARARAMSSKLADAMLKTGYAKPQEFEADSIALRLLADAGYDPRGLLDMLLILRKVQGSVRGGFNNTHPSPDERITNVNKSLAQYRVQNTRDYRAGRFKNTVPF